MGNSKNSTQDFEDQKFIRFLITKNLTLKIDLERIKGILLGNSKNSTKDFGHQKLFREDEMIFLRNSKNSTTDFEHHKILWILIFLERIKWFF